MGVPDAALVIGLICGISVAAGVTVLTWERRDRARRETVVPLLATLVVVVIWQLATVFMLLSPTRPLEVFFHRLGWNMEFVVTFPWLVFALYYTGRDHLVTRRTLAVLFAPYAISTVALWTPGLTSLFFTEYYLAGSDPAGLAVEYGPLFWATIIYAYAAVGVGVVLVVERFITAEPYRKPLAMLLVGVFVPWIASMVQFVGLIEQIRLQPTVYVFFTTHVAWYVAVFHMDLLDVLPLARERLFDILEDGVVVADRTGRVVDANPAARAVLGNDLVGCPVSELLAQQFDDGEDLLADERITRETTVDIAGERRHVELVSTPISASEAQYGEGRVGQLLLLRDVTPIRERELELRERTRELERQNERLDQFASLISHDLRNPLTVASGYLDMARDTGETEAFDTVDDAHSRIEEIIEDVLLLTRTGQAVKEREPVVMEDLVEKAWATVRTEAATLDNRFDDEAVSADESRLRQALENLFRNSVEHGTAGKWSGDDADEGVTIRVGPLDDGFYVADDGPGIPESDYDEVFDYGYTTGGTGLGLAIVKEIIEAHGWDISLEESSAGGVRFEIHTESTA